MLKPCTHHGRWILHTTKQLAVSLGKVGDLIGAGPAEDTLLGLSSVLTIPNTRLSTITTRGERERAATHPFHAVRGGDLAEQGLVAEDGNVRSVGELRVVGGGAEVDLALRRSEGVQLDGGGRLRQRCCAAAGRAAYDAGAYYTAAVGGAAGCRGLKRRQRPCRKTRVVCIRQAGIGSTTGSGRRRCYL